MMSEGIKTLVFAVVAAVVVLVAVVTKPRVTIPKAGERDGEILFEEFKNPIDAREMKIVRFNETQGSFSEFEIAQVDKRWVIPSHSNYPADAEAQLKEAALCLIDLKVLETKEVADPTESHKLYGVVEPDLENLKPGDQGVGVMVTMKGAEGKNLASLIISDKKVEGHTDKRFVRIPKQDPVYVVTIDPTKLTTKFSDWIEKDLLKLDAFNVEQLDLKDYSVAAVPTEVGLGHIFKPQFDLVASQEASGPGWKLDKFVIYRGQDAVPTVLKDDEELNSQKFDDVKSAVDNLEIVNVRKKPKGLSANLKADADLLKDREGLESLDKLGFYPLRRGPREPLEIMSANGEVVVRLKDGVEYLLRFGNAAGAQEGTDASKLNRYLLVTAQVAESKFPPLVLEPLPEDPAEEPAAKEEPSKEEAKEKDGSADETKEEGKKEEDKKEGDKKADDKKEGDSADEAKKRDDAKKAAEQKKLELKATRERITKENQRKEDDYKAKRKKAEDKVKELNVRFADWYYVISEDVFKKVHLSRVDLIKEKTATKDEGFGVDAFRKLEEGGIKEPEKKSDFSPPSGLPPGLPPGVGE